MENTKHWHLSHKSMAPFLVATEVFNSQECDNICKLAQKEKQIPGLVEGNQLREIRQNTVRWMNSSDPDQEWIFRRLTDVVLDLNKRFYNFDLEYIEILQFTEYSNPGDFYGDHMDYAYNSLHRRKLSFSLQLSDPANYQGSELEMIYGGDRREPVPKSQGTVILFPSFQMHTVTPLVSGQRNSLVGWVAGPPWK